MHAEEITLRAALLADSGAMASIHAECFPHYWNQDAFTDFFAVAGTFALLAECAGEAVAMLVVRPQYEQADILTLAVLPAFRRQKLAQRMLAAGLARAKQAGVEKLFLDVEENNLPAIRLYENAGFEHKGRRKLYYRQKDGTLTDALVMVKKL